MLRIVLRAANQTSRTREIFFPRANSQPELLGLLIQNLTRVVCWMILIGCMASGCGHHGLDVPTATISGIVTLDGQPVEKGTINFIPADGLAPTAGAIVQAGKYSLKAPKGEARIQISAPKVVGTRKIYDTPDSPIEDVVEENIPSIYNADSVLTYKVKTNQSNVDFDLKSDQK